MNLEKKVAIVTGAATGIGRAIAARFVKDGASVVIDYVGNSEPAKELVAALKNDRGRCPRRRSRCQRSAAGRDARR